MAVSVLDAIRNKQIIEKFDRKKVANQNNAELQQFSCYSETHHLGKFGKLTTVNP